MIRFSFLVVAGALVAGHARPADLQFDGHSWRVAAQDARVETHRGRETLRLEAGTAWLQDTELRDGVIEVDVLVETDTIGFGGLAFRAVTDTDFEEFYLRAHLGGQPDAVQYQPVINGVGAWQIHADGNAAAAAPVRPGEWMRVRGVVVGDRADFYVDGERPALHVPDLKRDPASGAIGLRASGLPFRFSRFSARPLTEGDVILGTPVSPDSLPDTLVTSWAVSDPFPEAALDAALNLPPDLIAARSWSSLEVESNGVANLARHARRTPETDTVLARLAIHATETASRKLHFGYSDRVRVYLNGRLLFAGDAGWATRDYRFLGTVGRQDSVGLHLRPGRNELVLAVSESFGGWAVTADLPDRTGLSIGP